MWDQRNKKKIIDKSNALSERISWISFLNIWVALKMAVLYWFLKRDYLNAAYKKANERTVKERKRAKNAVLACELELLPKGHAVLLDHGGIYK